LKRQEKLTDEQAKQAGVETISEREALERVAPGKYSVTLDSGKALITKEVNVRKENQGVQRVDVRKRVQKRRRTPPSTAP
jgi:hypothetical protein